MSQTLPETMTITIKDLEVRKSSSGKYAGKEYIIVTDENGKKFMISLFDEKLVQYGKTLRPGDIIEASVRQDMGDVIPRIQSIRVVGFDSEVAGSREREVGRNERTEITNRREALRLAVAVTDRVYPWDFRLEMIARCFDIFLEMLRTGYSKPMLSLAEELKKERMKIEKKIVAQGEKKIVPNSGWIAEAEEMKEKLEVSGNED